jgi:drug/metabolite transporter (DMT)-like permease
MVFVATDSLTKSLVSSLPVVDIVFGRYLTYLLAVILFAGRRNPRRLLSTARLGTQIARGLANFGATASFFLALSLLPLAETSTLASTTPLIVVALAGPILGERITRFAVSGAIVGFGGVVLLIGIDPSHLDPAILVPLGSAASYAVFSMLTRELRAEIPEVTLFYSGLVGMIASTVLLVAVPTSASPEPLQWAGIGLVGLSVLVGHRLLVAAYRWGRASDLAPLAYLSLVWSFLSGAILFREPVEPRAVAGALAIAFGGAVTFRATPAGRDPVSASVDYGDPMDLAPGAGRPRESEETATDGSGTVVDRPEGASGGGAPGISA